MSFRLSFTLRSLLSLYCTSTDEINTGSKERFDIYAYTHTSNAHSSALQVLGVNTLSRTFSSHLSHSTTTPFNPDIRDTDLINGPKSEFMHHVTYQLLSPLDDSPSHISLVCTFKSPTFNDLFPNKDLVGVESVLVILSFIFVGPLMV